MPVYILPAALKNSPKWNEHGISALLLNPCRIFRAGKLVKSGNTLVNVRISPPVHFCAYSCLQ